MRQPRPIPPGPGQESVWDYPRPSAIRPTSRRVRIVHRSALIADTIAAMKVCETSQLPAYYLPASDVRTDWLMQSSGRSMCEWKGLATYCALVLPGQPPIADVAWSYKDPTAPFAAIGGHFAFYASKLDECWVGDERVQPNPGSFYGGWWTPDVVGPFKGGPGSSWW
jgi:uncharacterized protein (DUF427 family)